MPIVYEVNTNRIPRNWTAPVLVPERARAEALDPLTLANEAARMVAVLKNHEGEEVAGIAISPQMNVLLTIRDPKRPTRCVLALVVCDRQSAGADAQWLRQRQTELMQKEDLDLVLADVYEVVFNQENPNRASVYLTSRQSAANAASRLANGIKERILSDDPNDWAVTLPIPTAKTSVQTQMNAFKRAIHIGQTLRLAKGTLIDVAWMRHGFAYATDMDGKVQARFIYMDPSEADEAKVDATIINEAVAASRKILEAHPELEELEWVARTPASSIHTGTVKGEPDDR